MAELITTLGAGVLAVPYVAGSGTMTVTPSVWPDGLPFPPSGVFSVQLKTGTGPKYPVYTVASFSTIAGNLVMTVALEKGVDTSAIAGAIVSESLTARALLALIAEGGGGGGGGGLQYHYQYFTAANSNNASNNLATMNGPNTPAGTGLNGPVGGFTAAGILTFHPGGAAQTMFSVRIPDSWDGSDITLDLDVAFSTSPGSGLFQSAVVCPAIDSNVNGPYTWTLGASVAVMTAATGIPSLAKCSLVIPPGPCSPGSLIWVGIVRPLDAFIGDIYIFGGNLGIKYNAGSGATVAAPFVVSGGSSYGSLSPALTPISTGFAWVNQNSISETVTNGCAQWQVPNLHLAANVSARVKTLAGAAPYAVQVGFAAFLTNNIGCGLVLTDGTKLITWTFDPFGGGNLELNFWTDPNTLASSPFVLSVNFAAVGGPIVLQVADDGTNLNYSVGVLVGGVLQFGAPLYSHARGLFLSATGWGYGIHSNDNVGTTPSTVAFLHAFNG